MDDCYNTNAIMKKKRLAALTTHPIQYQVPLWRRLAERSHIDLLVYFCSDFSAGKNDFVPELQREWNWGNALLQGYRSRVLWNAWRQRTIGFFGFINPGIVWRLISERPDALFVHGWGVFTHWLALFSAIALRIPFFLYGETSLEQDKRKTGWRKRARALALMPILKSAAACLYVGTEGRLFYEHYGVSKEKLIHVPYAVDNALFMRSDSERSRERASVRAELDIPQEAVIVLFVGKLIDKKRPFDLVAAVAAVQKNNPRREIHLLYVGNGPLEPHLEAYAKSRDLRGVHFVEFQQQETLPRYYSAADIFVLPSGIGETWGLVINEAMCGGLPVLASNMVGCSKDLVHNGENGYIFPVGDQEALAGHIEDLVAHPEKRSRFGAHSRNLIRAWNFDTATDGIVRALDLVFPK